MSNNNAYWGSKYGYYDTTTPKGQNFERGPTIRAQQWTTGASRSGHKQNKAASPQSRIDKEKFRLNGRPVIVHRWKSMAY